jgi:multidrug efflux pump subunit AcrA (membrane-fusion protein)
MPSLLHSFHNGIKHPPTTSGANSPIHSLQMRSEKAQEIISRQHGFPGNWALWLFLLLLLFIIAGTWLIRYPDVIEADATLSSDDAPKEIVIRQDGKLLKLFAANDSTVQQGQIIGWIESTASHPEVISLAGQLKKAELFLLQNSTEKVSGLFGQSFSNLGDLQTSYQQFMSAWLEFDDYLVNGYYNKRKSSLCEDLAFLQKIHCSLEEQQHLMQQDLTLTREAEEANDTLFRDSVISRQDLRDQKSKLMAKQMSSQQLTMALLNNETLQIEKHRGIDELEHTISQQKMIFRQALETLRSGVKEWMRKFLITAPVSGKVVFIVPLQENQFLQTGKTVGYVNPPDSRYYAQVMLPQSNFGKIRTGQKVKLRFDAYPYQEFGVVEGKLSYISNIPSDSGFLANIELPAGLSTNYKKELQYRSGLRSRALIITLDQRLLQRLYYAVVKGANQ